ncbi:hypothetical protein ACWGOK_40820 [Streptomyces eurythermus]
MPVSAAAQRVASHWADCRKHSAPPVLRQDIAEQAQSHLTHGADEDYLRRIAWWMATERPSWFDLSLAMTMSDAPQPAPSTAPAGGRTHRCPCRAALTAA